MIQRRHHLFPPLATFTFFQTNLRNNYASKQQNIIIPNQYKYIYYRRLLTLMAAQLKNEKFKNEIRQRHKDKIMSELRSKLHYQIQEDNLFDNLSKWRDYLEAPVPLIPLEAIKFFHSLEESDTESLEHIIQKVLEPSNLLNIMFVTMCVETYSINSIEFFKKVISSEKDKNYQQVALFTKLVNYEEVYLNYYVSFLKKLNLNRDEVIEIQLIEKIKIEFVDYWNKYVEEKCINFSLCAEIMERLLHFRQVIPELKPLTTGVISVLLDKDSSSQTYYLVKIILMCDVKLGLFITHHPNFPEFIYQGFKESTTKLVIQIIQILLQKIHQYGETEIKYLEVLKIMYQLLMKTENKNIQGYLLDAFYNFAFSQFPEVEQFYCQINYEEIYAKIYKKNLFSFLDFCLSVLFNYPKQQLFGKIINANELKLIEQSCDHILNQNNTKAWKYARDLLESIEMWVEHKIEVDYFCSRLQLVIKRLDSIKWVNNLEEKQRLMQDYEALIKRCAQISCR